MEGKLVNIHHDVKLRGPYFSCLSRAGIGFGQSHGPKQSQVDETQFNRVLDITAVSTSILTCPSLFLLSSRKCSQTLRI